MADPWMKLKCSASGGCTGFIPMSFEQWDKRDFTLMKSGLVLFEKAQFSTEPLECSNSNCTAIHTTGSFFTVDDTDLKLLRLLSEPRKRVKSKAATPHRQTTISAKSVSIGGDAKDSNIVLGDYNTITGKKKKKGVRIILGSDNQVD